MNIKILQKWTAIFLVRQVSPLSVWSPTWIMHLPNPINTSVLAQISCSHLSLPSHERDCQLYHRPVMSASLRVGRGWGWPWTKCHLNSARIKLRVSSAANPLLDRGRGFYLRYKHTHIEYMHYRKYEAFSVSASDSALINPGCAGHYRWR